MDERIQERQKYKRTKEWKKENTKERLNEKYRRKEGIIKRRKVGRKEINCLQSYRADLSIHQRALLKH